MDNPCPGQMTVYDRGTVTVTVNGHSDGTSYGSGSDNYSVASGLASAINGDGAASVTAAASNGVLSLTAKGVGLATNYSWSISSVSTDTTGNFGPDSSFWGSSSSGTLSGGVDGTTVWDSGTVNVTIGSFTASTGYGQSSNSTASQVASALASTGSTGLNRSGSPVTATASGATITFTYNSIGSTGNVAVSASSASNSTSYFPSGSFSGSTTLSGGQDAYSSGLAHPYATTYTYDPLNNLTGVSQAAGNFGGQAVSGQARSYSYDSLSRPLNATTPESGTVTNYYTNSSGGTCAGDPSLVCRMQDARGIVKTFSYDAMNRPTGVSYSDGTAPVTYQYDSGGTAAFALDRLTKITEGTGTTPNSQTFAYDNLGRIKSVSQVIDSTAYLVQYGYNALSQIASITYPTNRVVSQNYDAMGRPSAIADGSKTYMNALSFNPAGETLGFTYGNGVQAAFTYNDHLQISTLRYYKTGSSSDILNLSYDYGSSNNGQIQVIHYYTSPSVEDATKSEYFSYDGWGRLSAAHTGTVSSSTPGTWSLTWDYDRLGNRLHQNLVGGNTSGTGIGQPQFTVDVNTNRITNSGFSYDTAGNLTADGTNTYAYDGAGRMKQLNNTAATYTYFGPLRIKKVAGSTTTVYVYSGAAPIVEYVNGSLSKEYIYSGSKLLATLSSGSTTYHHPDHLSNRAETDSSGGVLRSYGHAPFGESWYETGTADKWKFTTYERDAESGLDYAQFRYYGSGQGRFLSADLMGGNPQVPQSLNRYNYSRNDPVNLIDPSGLMVICSQWQHSDDGGQNWYGTTPWQCEDTEGGGGHGALDDGSASGGGGPGGGGTGDGGRRNPVKIDFKKLMDCIAAMFQVKMTSFTVVSNDGTPGTFAGTTQNGEQVSLATDGTTYTSKDLSEIYKKNGGTNNVNGMTFDGFNWTSCCWGGFFSYQTSYVGSDLGYGQMLDNQVHELGHQLAKQTGKEPDLNSAHSEKLATDLQDCYNKKQ
ncbi:MAG TPA: RHS repeat-associated core domain-containing protein [Candidatus Angelobacter sp.]